MRFSPTHRTRRRPRPAPVPLPGALALAGALLAAPPSISAQEVDNLVHPPGTETAPLGTLGHVEKRGNGPVDLILIPGASFGSSVWEGFMDRNRERYTMWAVTPAGYDGTRPPPMPEGYPLDRRPWTDGLIDGLAELIRSEGMDEPIVVGHHVLGDYYARRLGLDHPGLVGGVVVLAGLPTRPQQARGASGAPRPATAEEKLTMAREQLLPMMKAQSRDAWVESAMAAEVLSVDAERGEALFRRQVANPIPTQLRYFMEWSGSSLTDRLPDLQDPMLVIFPQRWTDLDGALRSAPALVQRFGSGSAEAARTALLDRWGSEGEALARITSLALWRDLDRAPSDYRVRTVAPSGVFVMQDRPEETDRILARWIRERAPGGDG